MTCERTLGSTAPAGGLHVVGCSHHSTHMGPRYNSNWGSWQETDPVDQMWISFYWYCVVYLDTCLESGPRLLVGCWNSGKGLYGCRTQNLFVQSQIVSSVFILFNFLQNILSPVTRHNISLEQLWANFLTGGFSNLTEAPISTVCMGDM